MDYLTQVATDEPSRRKYKIIGKRLERWFLKTMINIELVANDFKIQIPTDLVEVAFGRRQFTNGQGLHTICRPTHKVETEERITYMHLEHPTITKQ